MKKILVWLLLALLLAGCAAPAEPAPTQPPATTAPTERVWEAFTAIPLEQREVMGLWSLGDQLLVRSPEGLARIRCDTLATIAFAEVAISVEMVQVREDRICCFDPDTRDLVLLDGLLQEQRRIPTPADMTGLPRLSGDGSSLYYCTAQGLRVLELETGVSRLLKEDPSDGKALEGLLLKDTVIHCSYTDPLLGQRSLFLSAATGQTLLERDLISIRSHGSRYYAQLPEEAVFGSPDRRSQMLLPRDRSGAVTLIPEADRAVTLTVSMESDETGLVCYDLADGRIAGELTLESAFYPRSFCGADGVLWFALYDGELDRDLLCRWDPEPVEDESCYTALYYTAGNPDTQGLQRCRLEAQRISDKFGVRVLIWNDAVQVQPTNHILEPEHRVPVLEEQLRLLEQRLANYPEGFFTQMGDVRICLVRSISPAPEYSAGTPSNGLQYWTEEAGYVAIVAGDRSEGSLYHELCHMIDSRVFTHSHAYDNWDSLNPGDFEYDYDYETNRSRDGSPFLQETSRSFVDTYSMSFPTEDRARIMEYAMLPGNEDLFSAPMLQQKLLRLCTGIREAFGLQDHPALLWEQYLLQPLAPAGA